MRSVDILAGAEVGYAVGGKWGSENPQVWFAERGWAIRTVMAVESAGALEDKVDRGKFGHHQVEVNVEALLDDLRANHDRALGPRRVAVLPRLFAESGNGIRLPRLPLPEGEPGMEEVRRDPVLLCWPLQDLEELLRPPNGVADVHRASALSNSRA